MKKRLFANIGMLLLFCLCAACSRESEFGTGDTLPLPVTVPQGEDMDLDFVMPHDNNLVKTTKGAAELDLETPLRCKVNWKRQEMISAVP